MVTCAKCGETLLGSVNRCWRCGQAFVAHGGPANLPPVVQPPDPALQPIMADVVAPLRSPAEALAEYVRRRPGWLASANLLGALGSLVVGAGALYWSCYTHWGLAIAAFGIVLGAWGAFSSWRPVALFGMLLCTLAIGVACVNLAIDVYEAQHGVHPMAPNNPVE